jgi:hypothetical protein
LVVELLLVVGEAGWVFGLKGVVLAVVVAMGVVFAVVVGGGVLGILWRG